MKIWKGDRALLKIIHNEKTSCRRIRLWFWRSDIFNLSSLSLVKTYLPAVMAISQREDCVSDIVSIFFNEKTVLWQCMLVRQAALSLPVLKKQLLSSLQQLTKVWPYSLSYEVPWPSGYHVTLVTSSEPKGDNRFVIFISMHIPVLCVNELHMLLPFKFLLG